MNDKSLVNYGYGFQVKIISSLLTDVNFCGKVVDILKVDYFEADAIKFLIKSCIDYFVSYKKTPTLEVLKVNIDTIDSELIKQEVVRSLKEAYINISASDLDFIKETTINFCKNQELKNAILKSVDLLKFEKYDDIKSVIDSAMKVGIDYDIGTDYIQDIDIRYTPDNRIPIPTGWAPIDQILKGGLSAGELGVIVAPSGIGKSWILSALGANAVKQGLNVVHYSLELSESYVGKRYDCILSGISLDKIDNYQSKVEDVLKKITGNLTIKWYPTKSISLIGIRSHISKLQALNLKPDLIIIDYADLLKFGNSTQAKHEALESLYEELRGLAGELQIPLYTASQANRESTTSDVIEADKMAGAYAKIFPADFVISISRKPQDKISNTARVHVIKNRFGIDGITFPVYMDTSRGIINIHDEDSGSGRELTKTMQTDSEYEKKRLKQRVTQLSGENSFLKDDKLKIF